MFHIWSCQLRQASASHRFDTYYGTTKARYQIYRNIMADDETYTEDSVQPAPIERNMGFLGPSIILVRGVDGCKTSLEQNIREHWMANLVIRMTNKIIT
jgi:hypothetical protein